MQYHIWGKCPRYSNRLQWRLDILPMTFRAINWTPLMKGELTVTMICTSVNALYSQCQWGMTFSEWTVNFDIYVFIYSSLQFAMEWMVCWYQKWRKKTLSLSESRLHQSWFLFFFLSSYTHLYSYPNTHILSSMGWNTTHFFQQNPPTLNMNRKTIPEWSNSFLRYILFVLTCQCFVIVFSYSKVSI